jgi:hypothetical protein
VLNVAEWIHLIFLTYDFLSGFFDYGQLLAKSEFLNCSDGHRFSRNARSWPVSHPNSLTVSNVASISRVAALANDQEWMFRLHPP